ncbi:uncharacterized protein DMAD_04780 [Drosophila madeirensis]|uniref:Protein sleepless n=1 Tax=Drosophila madeirensis TaxID=30013 RepID=A0AAU9GEU4_DROMD
MEKMSAVSQIPLRMALYVALLSLGITNALDCYICTYLDGYSDDSCVTNASAVKVLNCSNKYCLTMRQESIRNASKVISFLRDCQDKPMLPNGNTPDGSFRTYYSSCQQNLCNGHNGRIKNSTGGAASSGSGIHNAIVPGKNTGHSSSHGNGQGFAFAFGLGLFILCANRLRCCVSQLEVE